MKRKRRESQPTPQPAPKPPSVETTARPPLPVNAQLGILLAAQTLLLGWAAANNTHQLNTDAIAYLRLAEYWAGWQSDLMVSGYWGPLLSWLMVPWIKVGSGPLIAARIAMALSALVFSLGAWTMFGRLGLPGRLRVAGTGVCALASVYWSVELIAPDLLLAGLFCLAVGELCADDWLRCRRAQARAGLWWALAYFAKAVAFPLALGITVVMAGWHLVCRTTDFKQAGRSLAVTLGVFALIAGPWVAVLSVKYGGFTFSTSGRINHAIVGPGNADNIGRYHPFVREFHTPDPGRVTMWEDPSRMTYPFWSPFDGPAQMQHQLDLVRKNARTIAGILAAVDWFHLGLLSLIGCCLVRPPWRETLGRERWRWAPVPLLCLGGIYLPVYVQPVDERYFYAAQPLLLATALGLVAWATDRVGRRTAAPRLLALVLVLASFALFPFFRMLVATDGLRNEASRAAQTLTVKLRAADRVGPIAGSGLVEFQRSGLYTAYLLGVPWHGDELDPTPERFLASGVRVVMVPRGTAEKPQPLAKALAEHPGFRSLDAVLFATPAEASEFPVQVFERVQ